MNASGGYYWVNGEDGACTADWLSDQEFQSLVNQDIAAGDEAIGNAVPTDIPSQDASAGASEWDSLAAGGDLKSGAMEFLQNVGDWPAWSSIGEIALGVGAFEIGWKVGSVIANIAGIDSGSGSVGQSNAPSIYYPESGYWALCTISAGWEFPAYGGQCGPTTSPLPPCVNYAPSPCTTTGATAASNGFLVQWTRDYQTLGPGVDTCGAVFNDVPPDATYVASINETSAQCGWSGLRSQGGFYIPAQIDALPGPGQGSTDPGNDITMSPPASTEQQQRTNAASALQSPSLDSYNQYLCTQPESSCYQKIPIAIPAIMQNESPVEYAKELTLLGLQVNNSRSPTVTLPDSQVAWGTDGGDVVSTQPAPGDAVASGSNVTIYANPTTLPTPTQREADLATSLQAKNAGITDRNKLDIARSCLDLEDAATGNTDTTGDSGDESFANCSSMPIFITGYDAKSAGQHDEIALGENPTTDPTLTFTTATGGVDPAWVLLHYYPAGWSRGWLNPPPAGSGCDSSLRSSTVQCDEYPFASVYEGGAANNPNLQVIDGSQNNLQGRMLGGFYGSGPYAGLQGCDLPDEGRFLAIPVPDFASVNTTWACNGAG